jgi:hypothetical protein
VPDVIFRAAELTVTEKVRVVEAPATSRTDSENVKVPATVEVPERVAATGSKVNPGTLPLTNDHVYGAVPPTTEKLWT